MSIVRSITSKLACINFLNSNNLLDNYTTHIIRVFLLIFVVFSTKEICIGQDPIFSQYYNAPMLVNSAFAGNSTSPNVSTIYRNQLPGIPNAFQTLAASYDQYFEKYNSGFGLVLSTDAAGSGALNTTKVAGVYSYKLQVGKNASLKGSIDVGLGQRRLNWDKFVFFDALDPEFGLNLPNGPRLESAEIRPENQSFNYTDLGVGLLYFSRNYYLGTSFGHINSPRNSFLNPNTNSVKVNNELKLRTVVQAGASYYFGRTSRESDAMNFIAPHLLFVNQGGFSQVNLGVYSEVNSFISGLAYRHAGNNGDAIILNFGARVDQYKITYSFDYNISGLAFNGYGSHELSFLINFRNETKKSFDINNCLQLFR